MLKRTLACAAFPLIANALAICSPGSEENSPKDLIGTWEIVTQVVDGENDPFRETGSLVTFDGKALCIKRPKEDPERAVEYKTRADVNPKEIDWQGESNGRVWIVRGIYELQGGGLRICARMDAAPGPKRPVEFRSKSGDETFLLTLSRRSDKVEQLPAPRLEANGKKGESR